MAEFGSKIIAAFEAGRRARMDRERMGQEQEDRKLQKEILQHQIRALGIDEKIKARTLAMQNVQLQEGRPGETLPGSGGPARVQPETTAGAASGLQATSMPIPGRIEPSELPHAPVAIPGVEELDVSGTTVTPLNLGQTLRQLATRKQIENVVEVPGMGPADVRTLPFLGQREAAQGAETRATQQREFTAGENELDRVAAAARTEATNNARLQAAGAAALRGELNSKQLSASLQLANSLKSHPAYTDMQDIATGIHGVQVGLSQKNGFGDITAINSFQRMVDPGATVREGDVALLQTASSIVQRILSEYPIEKLRVGAKLPDAVREQMLKAAKELYERRAKNYNEAVGNQYRKLAEAAGIPFEYVGQDFELQAGQPAAQPQLPNEMEVGDKIYKLQPDGTYK